MSAPAFQFYPDDFLAGTCDMTQNEVGAYVLLLCQQWNRGSIPVEPERQQLLAKGSVSDHVLKKFKKGEDGLLRNERLETERKKQTEYRERQRLKGIASGRKRATEPKPQLNRGSLPVGHLVGSGYEPEGNSPSPSPSPISTSTKVLTKSSGTLDEVKAFIKELGLPETDAVWFFHKCEGNGWTNGGKKIKDWRATIRAWRAAQYMPSQKQIRGQQPIQPTLGGGNL